MALYRNAHWWLLALLPLTVLAFWPGYFSQIRGASLGHHVHGTAGLLWITLAAAQSWSAATRRFALHRALGQAVYVIIPLFVAGGAMALVQGAAGFVAGSDPFRTAFAARLTPADGLAALAVPLLVRDALIHRRRAVRHAAGMLATVLLVLPPMFGRLMPWVPGFPHSFVASFYVAELLGAGIAAAFWWRDRKHGAAFLVVALVDVTQCLSFGLLPGDELTRAVATLAPLPVAALAAGAAALLLWRAKLRVMMVARPVPAG